MSRLCECCNDRIIVFPFRFLYQGREVSYRSVLDRSISTRRQALYKSHGFDIERWADLLSEERALRKEIGKIAEDYDEETWKKNEKELEQRETELRSGMKEINSDDEQPHNRV